MTIPSSPNPHIWGKTVTLPGQEESYYPLLGHLLDTATVAGVLWEHWLRSGLRELIEESLGPKARQLVQLAAGLHDLGKCSPIFQGQMLSAQRARPEMVSLLREQGFDFPDISDPKSYRLNLLHRHEKLGLYSLTESVQSASSDARDSWLELALLGHHGSFKISYGNRRHPQEPSLRKIFTDSWIAEQKTLISLVERSTGAKLEDALDIRSVPHEAIILISGLIVLSDRIASTELSVIDAYQGLCDGRLSLDSSEEWLRLRTPFLRDLSSRELGFPVELSRSDVLGDYSPRGIQKSYPSKRGLWLCMAPTGAGKTEAALLRHSESTERLIFLLPTLSTTNAMMGRLLKVYGSKPATTAVLGHGLAYLEDFYSAKNRGALARDEHDDCGLVPTDFARVNGAKLSASVNVATIDQLLMGSFPIKWSPLRWLLISNSHIIIDEAHLLDHYQIELLNPLLRFLGRTGGRVSILSATLPNWLENSISKSYSMGAADRSSQTAFPSSVLVEPKGCRFTDTAIEVERYSAKLELVESSSTLQDHVSWARESLSSYPRARLGIFVNQVKRAQQIAQKLRAELPSDVEIICLHSRMLARHRKQATDRLLEFLKTGEGTGERMVVVGTQVIEMSLDIDLDLISTDICPAPSLIQRMGRAWRKRDDEIRFDRISRELNPRMAVRVALPLDSNGSLNPKELLPYRESVLLRTASYLRERSELIFPDDLQDFVETVLVDPESIENRGEEDEFADTIYRTLRGKDVAIDAGFLDSNSWSSNLTLQQYGSKLTDSDLVSEEFATRLVEGPQGEPFVLRSQSAWLQDLGALPPDLPLEKAGARRAQSGSVSLSMRMSSLLDKDEAIEKLEIKDLRTWGYFGELPGYLSYDKLVGLTEVDQP